MTTSDLFLIATVVSRRGLRAALLGPEEVDQSLPTSTVNRALSMPPPGVRDVRLKLSAALASPPPWSIGFSKQFKKDTTSLDRKMMGRLLEVLEELSDYEPPFKAQGDTFKPLNGDLDGCWRYRIGDNRLVIRPMEELGRLDAITFASRGSVYD